MEHKKDCLLSKRSTPINECACDCYEAGIVGYAIDYYQHELESLGHCSIDPGDIDEMKETCMDAIKGGAL